MLFTYKVIQFMSSFFSLSGAAPEFAYQGEGWGGGLLLEIQRPISWDSSKVDPKILACKNGENLPIKTPQEVYLSDNWFFHLIIFW